MSEQNSFVSLKKYSLGNNDPKENHATESLVLCLRTSQAIKTSFMSFLVAQDPALSLEQLQKAKIYTQETLQDGSRPDIWIEYAPSEALIIEVKVGASATYKQRNAYKESGAKLFGLICYSWQKNELPDFDCFYWREIVQYLEKNAGNYNATDKILFEQLQDYLNREGIIMNWQPKEILAYEAGRKASVALEKLFGSILEILKGKEIAPSYVCLQDAKYKDTHSDPRLDIPLKSAFPLIQIYYQAKEPELNRCFLIRIFAWHLQEQEKNPAALKPWPEIFKLLPHWEQYFRSHEFSIFKQKWGREAIPWDPSDLILLPPPDGMIFEKRVDVSGEATLIPEVLVAKLADELEKALNLIKELLPPASSERSPSSSAPPGK